jgi:hypothetical protein
MASKSLLLALVDGFIVSDLISGQRSNRRILTKVIRPILFLSCLDLLSPIWDRLQNVYGSLLTGIYTEQISASLQVRRDLDSCIFRQPVCVRTFLPEHLTGKYARLAGKT